jgi:hypothetical protein
VGFLTDAHGGQHSSHRTTWPCSPGFTGYFEDLPSVCFTGCSAPDRRYARNHKPPVDFANLPAKPRRPAHRRCRSPQPVPDMHDRSLTTGDAWARDHLANYLH